MRVCRYNTIAIIIAIAMLFLIVNASDSLVFARDAINLCTDSLIPSLFPFIFLAILLNNILVGYHFRFLGIVNRLCRIPQGSEILFLLGILGGYPVGAQMIASTYRNGNILKKDAQRMLGFCNNAGPSFIFGVIGPLFHSGIIPLILWLIQIISAILTGILLPGACSGEITVRNQPSLNITNALEKSIKNMGLICGWVLLFRVLVGFIKQYFSNILHPYITIMVTGMLELTNGCIALWEIGNPGTRFVLSSLFLSVGGLCVALQTSSIARPLNIKYYISGKCIQGLISTLLSIPVQYIIFSQNEQFVLTTKCAIIVIFSAIILLIFLYRKKTVAIQNILVYN